MTGINISGSCLMNSIEQYGKLFSAYHFFLPLPLQMLCGFAHFDWIAIRPLGIWDLVADNERAPFDNVLRIWTLIRSVSTFPGRTNCLIKVHDAGVDNKVELHAWYLGLERETYYLRVQTKSNKRTKILNTSGGVARPTTARITMIFMD